MWPSLLHTFTKILATDNTEVFEKTVEYKENLKSKIVKANEELSKVEYKFKV